MPIYRLAPLQSRTLAHSLHSPLDRSTRAGIRRHTRLELLGLATHRRRVLQACAGGPEAWQGGEAARIRVWRAGPGTCANRVRPGQFKMRRVCSQKAIVLKDGRPRSVPIRQGRMPPLILGRQPPSLTITIMPARLQLSHVRLQLGHQ